MDECIYREGEESEESFSLSRVLLINKLRVGIARVHQSVRVYTR